MEKRVTTNYGTRQATGQAMKRHGFYLPKALQALPETKLPAELSVNPALLQQNLEADIQELRKSYQAVVNATSAVPQEEVKPLLDERVAEPVNRNASPAVVTAVPEEGLNALFDHGVADPLNSNPSLLVRFLNRPRLVVSVTIAVCLLCSVVYAGLGYWLLTSARHPAQKPAEFQAMSQVSAGDDAVSMLGLAESSDIEREISEDHTTLENIQILQKQTGGIQVPQEDKSEEPMLAQAIAESDLGIDSMITGRSNVPGLKAIEQEPVGRVDPFSPLVQSSGLPTLGTVAGDEKDVLQNLQFTGYIGDINSKDKVALIRVTDAAFGQKTLIKKVGESFTVEGEKVILKEISKNALQLRISGVSRRLELAPYIDAQSSMSSSTSSSSAGSGVGTNVTAAQAGAAVGAGAVNAAASSRSSENVVNPSLMEPGN